MANSRGMYPLKVDPSSEPLKFPDGDVAVIISMGKIHQLHSHTLRQASLVFAELLDYQPGAKLTAAARRDGHTPYRLELCKSLETGPFGRFTRVLINENGKPLQQPAWGSPFSTRDFGRADDTEKYWGWFFGSLYSIPPKFDDHNLATVLSSCMGLVDAAETIGAVDKIREHAELALLRQDQVLWQSIAANATAWTELGCRIHSPAIFREGATHLVGMWQSMNAVDKNQLRLEIQSIIDRKWQELDSAKRAVDIRILGHYPPLLNRNHADKPHRNSYSTDIYMWMVVCFFRQWYCQAMIEHRDNIEPDGGFALYHKIAQGGNAYLNHEDFENFHQFFPMSSKACNVLEANMTALKEEMKDFVKDLVIARTHIEGTDTGVTWLTCAIISKDDLPWVVDDPRWHFAQQLELYRSLNLDLFEDDNGSEYGNPLNGAGMSSMPSGTRDMDFSDLNDSDNDEDLVNGGLPNSTLTDLRGNEFVTHDDYNDDVDDDDIDDDVDVDI